jgi:hypothetical protein
MYDDIQLMYVKGLKTDSLFQFDWSTQMHFSGDKVHAKYHRVKYIQNTVILIFACERLHSGNDTFLIYNKIPTA